MNLMLPTQQLHPLKAGVLSLGYSLEPPAELYPHPPTPSTPTLPPPLCLRAIQQNLRRGWGDYLVEPASLFFKAPWVVPVGH